MSHFKTSSLMWFDIFRALLMKITALRDMMPCLLAILPTFQRNLLPSSVMSSQMNSKFWEELVALYTEVANYVIVKVSQEEKCGMDRAMCRTHRGKRSTKQLRKEGPNKKMRDKGQLTTTKNRLKRQPTAESKGEKLGSADPQTAITLLLHILEEGFLVPSESERGFHNLPFIPLFRCIVEPIQPATYTSDFLDVWGTRLLCNFINKLPVDTVSYHIRLILCSSDRASLISK